uniref:Uncharacterized protein n=1 Tax=Aplanochytrium stocchinoi TaxID=215587 RepID=A0A7S3LLP8_9STRA
MFLHILQVAAGYWQSKVPFFRVNRHITQFGPTQQLSREQDPFLEIRDGAKRDENPYGGVGKDEDSVKLRKLHPWRRGTIASIGGKHFVVVIRPNKQMGINRHDAPLGFINEYDMQNVFDNLYQYNDIIDKPQGGAGPDQVRLVKEGLDYIMREFPKTDFILGCKRVSKPTYVPAP